MEEKKIEHPAFGMIGISQISSTGSVLVGSSVKHNHFLKLVIKSAVKYESNYHERFYGERKLCEISLSHSQLAEMLFSVGHGDGVPCTLNWVIGDTEGRPAPIFENPFEKSSENLKENIQNTFKKAKELAKEAEALLKNSTLKKADRERLAFLASNIVADIEHNIPFSSTCVDEKIEKTIVNAKTEIESFVDMSLRSKGLETLKNELPKLTFENKKNGEK